MAGISGSIKLSSAISQTLAAGATRPDDVVFPLNFDVTTKYTDGTAANQANRIYYRSGSAAGTPFVLDLTAAVCVGGEIGFTNIREIVVYNDDTDATHFITYGGGTTPFQPWLAGTTPTELIQAGVPMRHAKPLGTTGWAVSTTINVKIDPGAFTIPYRILILGN